MTRHEIEESLKQWNTMVHEPKAFKPNCIYVNSHGKIGMAMT